MDIKTYTGGEITEDGIYAGIPIEDYHHNVDLFPNFSISSTGLRAILDRPSKYWMTSAYNPNAEEDTSTTEMNFGAAAHMLLLGETGFKERFVLRPDKAPGDPEGRSWNGNNSYCRQWLRDQAKAGRTVIKKEDLIGITKIARSIERHPIYRTGSMSGLVEHSIIHTLHHSDPIQTITLKSRPDLIPNADGDFVDIKTCGKIDTDFLMRQIYNSGYHIQAALMKICIQAVTGTPDSFRSFTFLFCESSAPYDVRAMELSQHDIELGELQIREAIKTLRRCIVDGEWPGYDGFGQDVGHIGLPSWAATRIKIGLGMPVGNNVNQIGYDG